MEILTREIVNEWCRIDPNTDDLTIAMLEASAIDTIEHELGLHLRPYRDASNLLVTPTVPISVKHAIAVFISAHFDDRTGAQDAAMTTIRRLCAPFRVVAL